MIPLRDDNPSATPPIVAVTVIGLCVLAFVWQLTLPPAAVEAAMFGLGFVPAVLFGQAELAEPFVPPLLTVFTSMFLHGGLLHLAGNMLYLWVFGDNVEDSMGHARFIVFYALCGIAAALTQALPDVGSTVPMIGRAGRSPACSGLTWCCFRAPTCWSRYRCS